MTSTILELYSDPKVSASLLERSPMRSSSLWLPDDNELILAAKAKDSRFLERYLDRLSLDRLETLLTSLIGEDQHDLWIRVASLVEGMFPISFPEGKYFAVGNPKRWFYTKPTEATDWISFRVAVMERGYAGLLLLSHLQVGRQETSSLTVTKACAFFSVEHLRVLSICYSDPKIDPDIRGWSIFGSRKIVENIKSKRPDEAFKLREILITIDPRFGRN